METEKEVYGRFNQVGFNTIREWHKAVKRFFMMEGYKIEKARYNDAGNCLTCGESGRCYGWHFQRGF